MTISKENTERFQMVIHQLHCVDSRHIESVHVNEDYQGETIWKGNGAVFELIGHTKARRFYAWTHGDPKEFVTILELPPVDSPQSVVKVGLAYQIKNARSN